MLLPSPIHYLLCYVESINKAQQRGVMGRPSKYPALTGRFVPISTLPDGFLARRDANPATDGSLAGVAKTLFGFILPDDRIGCFRFIIFFLFAFVGLAKEVTRSEINRASNSLYNYASLSSSNFYKFHGASHILMLSGWDVWPRMEPDDSCRLPLFRTRILFYSAHCIHFI
ncbi:hypothetical protein F5H01DRAFT_72246 [Linnemannia elongata]|nr:hypothetical protein F5H01DRAFT_72246 [Linnemannia elongata]